MLFNIALMKTTDGKLRVIPLPDRMDLASTRWLSLHINLAHLEALARHQGRR